MNEILARHSKEHHTKFKTSFLRGFIQKRNELKGGYITNLKRTEKTHADRKSTDFSRNLLYRFHRYRKLVFRNILGLAHELQELSNVNLAAAVHINICNVAPEEINLKKAVLDPEFNEQLNMEFHDKNYWLLIVC